jgi:maltose alpha-D-glucosyltransferase/alpha-amylase
MYLKGFRRLYPGLHPEYEIGRFLTDASPFAHIAPVAGAVEYVTGTGEEALTLAILQKYVENQGDAWTFTLDHLDRTLGHPLGQEGPQPEGGPHGFYLAQLATLARRVAGLHHAFAKVTGDPDFDPEPVPADEIERWRTRVLEDADTTLSMLESTQAQLPAEIQPEVERLIDAREALQDRVRGLGLDSPGLAKTRYHGDLHLGQVLLAQNDFVIIDFEGEPGRSIEERRCKHSPLRDVAGMVRSLDYAAHSTLARLAAGRADAAALAGPLVEWERSAQESFLRAYDEAAGELPSLPADPAVRRNLIDLFAIEKALYEVRYELEQRPEWVLLPVRGLLSLVQRK